MRAMPISVANPRTASQIEQRNKFSSSIYFAKKILSTAIKPLWDRWAVRMSGYNAFIAKNIEFFGPDYLLQPANLVFSEGKMAATPIDSISYDSVDNTLTLNWYPDSADDYQTVDDVAYAGIWVSEVKDKVEAIYTGRMRSHGNGVLYPSFALSTGDVVHVWLSFKRQDGTVVSNSSHSTITIP
jgi:hypothetical protein